jgi:DNA polymerase-3 subunit beta
VRLTATDLERHVATTFGATTTGSGKALLPAKRLLEIVNSFPNAAVVTIVVEGRKARVSAGRSRFDVLGMSVDEFPMSPEFQPKVKSQIEGKAFVNALGRVAPFVSTVQGNPESGALLEAADDGIFLVAAERRRMGRVKIAETADFRAQCIIPKESFAAIKTLFAGEEALQLTAGPTQVRLEGKHSTLTTLLLGGQFPPYRMLITKEPKGTVIVYAAELVNVVKRVGLLAPEDGKFVTIFVHEKELHLVTQAPDAGTARDVLECRHLDDWTAVPKISIHPQLLTSVVEGIGADEKGEIALQLNGPERAIYVRPASTLTSPTIGIVMPLRTLVDVEDED